MGQRHAPPHCSRHHYRPRQRRPDRYEVHKAKARGQTVAMVVLAGVVLVLLFVFVGLFLGERDGTSLDLARPLRTGPRQ
jgi:hypothetical protein